MKLKMYAYILQSIHYVMNCDKQTLCLNTPTSLSFSSSDINNRFELDLRRYKNLNIEWF